jgi:esterase/lipase
MPSEKITKTHIELSRLSGISMGGLIGLRKSTQISPNIATKLAETFGYDNWQDMLEEDQKKERRKAKPPVSKDRKEMMEARVAELEKELVLLKKRTTKK